MATIYGSSGNDSLTGTTSADALYGGNGDDTLAGGLGADTLYGGNGTDTTDYTASNAAVNVSLSSGYGYGGHAQGDRYSSIENVTGSSYNDTLYGSSGANVLDGGIGNDWIYGGSGADTLIGGLGNDALYGGNGDDLLIGGPGADTLDGGSGEDTVDYTSSEAGVSVDLGGSGLLPLDLGIIDLTWLLGAGGVGSGLGDSEGDYLTSIEHAVGSEFGDVLNGSSAANMLWGGGGNDVLLGGGGNDTLYGGTGTDWLDGGTGNDWIYGGDGNDTLTGGAGADTLYGGAGIDTADYSGSGSAVNVNLATGYGYGGDANGDRLYEIENLTGSSRNDTLTGDSGNNVLDGGAGNDALYGGDGDDTLIGGAGADTLVGGEDLDIADYSASNAAVHVNLATMSASGGHAQGDVLQGIDGVIGSAYNDTLLGYDEMGLSGDVYTNEFYGGAGDDYMDGLGGNDSLYGGTGNDTVLGGAGDDSLWGDEGNDSVDGGTGNDTLYGGAGADHLSGGAGNDLLYGGDGADTLVAGDQDTLYGGAGNDQFTGTGGAALYGGDGSDQFIGVNAGHIDGGEGTDDMDVLDLTGMGRLRVSYDPLNPENGTVTFYGPTGLPTGTMTFVNIEQVIPCFTPGTRIACETGEKAVEELVAGDRVITRDHGLQELRWIGRKSLTRAELAADPRLQPVLIRAGALGAGLPERDMRISRQHRMMMTGPRAELLFGADEVLVRAEHLLHLPGVAQAVESDVTYLHILFDRHEVVLADGAWSESFQPGDRTLAGLDGDARDELFSLFPELAQDVAGYEAVRPTLKRFEVRALLAA